MPLKFKLAAPVEGWYYTGQFNQEDGGPLGQGKRLVRTSLTVERSPNFPAHVTLRVDVNNVLICHADGTATRANPNSVPELAALAHLKMDRYGHISGRYNPDEFPLCLVSDLWPLPPKPMDDDEDYIEKIERTDENGLLRFEGTRKITLYKTRLFKGVPCAIMAVYTNLDGQYTDDPESRPSKLNIDSHIVFDMHANWPRFINQKIIYAGKTRRKDGSLRDFRWHMEWDSRCHKLKPPPPGPEKPPAPLLSLTAGEPIKPVSVKVAGVRMVRYVDEKRGITPFYHQKKGYSLSLVVELPDPNLPLVGGRVHKAVTDTGQNILPQRDLYIYFPRLSNDKKAARFDVELSLPDANATALSEFSGALYALKSTGTRKIDLGLMDFKTGAESKLVDCLIDSIRVKQSNKEYTYMRLKANLPRASVKRARFYRRDGTEIEVSRGGWSYAFDRIKKMEFKTKGQFPPKGRIVLEVLDNITKHKIPFKLTNVSLLGQLLTEHHKHAHPRDSRSLSDGDIARTHNQGPLLTESEKSSASVPSSTPTEAIKPLRVKAGGVRLIRYSDKERGIRPFGRQKGYTLSVILELPEPNLIMINGQIQTAITDTGQDVLPERGGRIFPCRLSKDKKAVVFDVDLLVPEKDVDRFAEISGTLNSLRAAGTRKIDLGIIDFKAGAKSGIDGFSIESVKKLSWDKQYTEMNLNVSLLRGSVKNVTLYREDGTEIEVHRTGTWSHQGRIRSIGYKTKGSFPPKGRIVFEVLDNVTQCRIPFQFTNISLLGQ